MQPSQDSNSKVMAGAGYASSLDDSVVAMKQRQAAMTEMLAGTINERVKLITMASESKGVKNASLMSTIIGNERERDPDDPWANSGKYIQTKTVDQEGFFRQLKKIDPVAADALMANVSRLAAEMKVMQKISPSTYSQMVDTIFVKDGKIAFVFQSKIAQELGSEVPQASSPNFARPK